MTGAEPIERKAVSLLVAVAVCAGCSGTGDPASSAGQEADGRGKGVVFADSSLGSAVRRAIGEGTAPPTQEQVLSLTRLEASDRGIGSLVGIEYLSIVQSLDLSANRIGDLSPLDALMELRMLDLAGNMVTDLSPLRELPNLQVLVLDGNPIESLAILLELSALVSLDVMGITCEGPELDGEVAALRERGVEVYVTAVEAERPPEEEVVEIELPGPIAPDNQIIFMSTRSGKGPTAYVMDADAPEPKVVLESWEASYPSWSPDRSRLAYHTDSPFRLFVSNTDGGNAEALVDMGWFPSWSPDGTRLVYNGFEVSGGRAMAALFTVEIDGRLVTRITELTSRGGEFHQASWSPDGTQIAVTKSQDGIRDICVMDVDGSNLVNLTQNAEDDHSAAWSPDGARIAFTSTRDGNPQIYVMDRDGSNPTRLTQHPDDGYDPTWSPDGTRIAFVSDRDANQEIYLMNADGSQQVRLTRHQAFDWAPSWSAW